MTDISIYFSPVEIIGKWQDNQIGSKINANKISFPEINKNSIALLFVPEYRGFEDKEKEPICKSRFREAFYELQIGSNWNSTIYDLGDILPGNNLKDTYFALSQVVFELVKINTIPIVIGGSQDLVLALYGAYEKLEQMINICSVDNALNLGAPDVSENANGYLSHLLLKRPCYLFNHANIGLQIPYSNTEELALFEKLYFDICRLGEFNADFKYAEPHLRNSDIINVDFESIKASETMNIKGLANGFYAEQICQIAKYAGISDKVSSLGIFNYTNFTNVADQLLAEMIWYFVDGVASRFGDFPIGSKVDYKRFTVFMEESNHELVFYKSNKSSRWWMEVPFPPSNESKYERHHIVPCNKLDYENAMKSELPDLWWKTYQKLF
jgi:formiminoglutamase